MSDSIYELARENQSMTSSRTSVDSRKSLLLSCRICFSNIFDPASLTCGHKFCEKCLQKYWDAKDRPDFIVCPLCRSAAYNVDFAKKGLPCTENHDFRKTFNLLEDIAETQEAPRSLSCFKLSMLLPAVYYLLKWLGLPILE